MLNVFALAKEVPSEVEGVHKFDVQAGALYPAALAHLRECVHGARPGDALGQYWDRAKRLDNSDVTLAEIHGAGWSPDMDIWEFAQEATLDEASAVSASAREARAEALELARLWFTELLHAACGQAPLHLHIFKDETHDWRL